MAPSKRTVAIPRALADKSFEVRLQQLPALRVAKPLQQLQVHCDDACCYATHTAS